MACLSVRIHETPQLLLDGFSWNFAFKDFSKIYPENLIFIKIRQEYRELYRKANTNLW